MSTRERWIVYPLLFLTLGIAMRNQFLPTKRFGAMDLKAADITAQTIHCNNLEVMQDGIVRNNLGVVQELQFQRARGNAVRADYSEILQSKLGEVECRKLVVTDEQEKPVVVMIQDQNTKSGVIQTMLSNERTASANPLERNRRHREHHRTHGPSRRRHGTGRPSLRRVRPISAVGPAAVSDNLPLAIPIATLGAQNHAGPRAENPAGRKEARTEERRTKAGKIIFCRGRRSAGADRRFFANSRTARLVQIAIYILQLSNLQSHFPAIVPSSGLLAVA